MHIWPAPSGMQEVASAVIPLVQGLHHLCPHKSSPQSTLSNAAVVSISLSSCLLHIRNAQHYVKEFMAHSRLQQMV